MLDKRFDLSVIFRVLDKASQPVKNVARNFRKLSVDIAAAGTKMKQLGRDLSLKLTLPIVTFGALSLKASMNFNEAMANIGTLIPGQSKRLNQLKDDILDLSVEMGKAPADVAKATYDMISALGDSEETMEKVKLAGMVARSGMASMEQAARLLIIQTGAYGDTSYKAFKKAADLSFQTVKLGVTTFPELAEAMGNVIPLAAQLGIEQEKVAGMMSTLTGKTGNTAAVTTQLAGAMTAILKESPLMEEAVKELSKRYGYQAKSAVELTKEIGFFETYSKFYELVGRDEKWMTELIGGRKEALMAVFTLMGKMSPDYAEKSEKMKKVDMALAEAWKEQTIGLNKTGFAWDQFKARLSRFSIMVGDTLSPSFEKIIKRLEPLVDLFGKLDKATKNAIVGVGVFAAIVGPSAAALGIFLKIFGSAALGTVSAVGFAFVGIGAALFQVIRYWKQLKEDFLENPFSFIIDFLSVLTSGIIPKFEEWKNLIKSIVDLTKDLGEKFIDILPGFMKEKLGIKGSGTKNNSISKEMQGSFAWMEKYRTSQTDINIKVTSDSGTMATVEKVKKKSGDANVNVATVGYVGATK